MLEWWSVKRRVSKSAPRRAPPVAPHEDQPTIVVGANTQILQVNHNPLSAVVANLDLALQDVEALSAS